MDLKINSKGNDVVQLQNMLNKLGYTCGIADGILGIKTEASLKRFQTDNYVNGICDDKVFNDLTNLYNKKIIKEQSQNKGYRKIRMFDSDIHIYETSPDEFVDVTLGIEGKLEKLSKIDNSNVKEICKINGGFFNFDGSAEHLGMYLNSGKLYNNPDNTFINFIYYKNGKTDIKYYSGNYEEMRYWLKELHWGIGCGWSLVKGGKIDLTGVSLFDHNSQRHPRTLVAHKQSGEFLLIVVDGRTSNSKGITASQSAQLLMELNAWNGVSLDGGHSSEMIVNDKIMNEMILKVGERSIGSSIVVYKK